MLTGQINNTISNPKHKTQLLAIVATVLAISATGFTDFLVAQNRQSLYYWTESLLFSVYWLIFLPLLTFCGKWVKQHHISAGFAAAIVLLCCLVHLTVYPALIWVLSELFFYQNFAYTQTLHFGVTNYSIVTLIVYGFSLVLMKAYFYQLKSTPTFEEPALLDALEPCNYINSILVEQKRHKKIVIATEDIFYFLANSPYVTICHPQQNFVHSQTLKALEAVLDPQQFVRIHKSCIVNIGKVAACQSRLNGDYDLTLTNNTVLRLSRNYAAAFKARFQQTHPFATK